MDDAVFIAIHETHQRKITDDDNVLTERLSYSINMLIALNIFTYAHVRLRGSHSLLSVLSKGPLGENQ